MVYKKTFRKVGRELFKPGTFKRVGTKYGRSIGADLGSTLGPGGVKIGGKAGAWIGKKAGKGVARLVGFGDYYVTRGKTSRRPAPKAQNLMRQQRGLQISRTEFIGDVYSGPGAPTTFDINKFLVNPGLSTNNDGAFNWLTQIARGYESYRFKQLVFHFRSTSGDATGGNTSLGQVIMATQYDNTRPAFQNKQDMLNTMFSISGPPSSSFSHAVECNKADQRFKWLDVRTNSQLAPGANINLKDFVTFYIATEGMQTARQQLGELHVSYTVEFTKYQYNRPGTSIPSFLAWERRDVPASQWDFSNDDPLATSVVSPWQVDPDSTIAIKIAPLPGETRNVIQFPSNMTTGEFTITIYWQSNAPPPGGVNTNFPTISGSGFVRLPVLGTASQDTLLSNEGIASGVLAGVFSVRLTGPNAYIDLGDDDALTQLPDVSLMRYLQLQIVQKADGVNVPNLGAWSG